MNFYVKRLANGRFGIYKGQVLLATIGCSQTCQVIVQMLQARQCANADFTSWDLERSRDSIKQFEQVS